MTLFEATNGMEGNSYVRRYVWASDAARAKELLSSAVDDAGQSWDLRPLMHADSAEFVIGESSDGWESSGYPASGTRLRQA